MPEVAVPLFKSVKIDQYGWGWRFEEVSVDIPDFISVVLKGTVKIGITSAVSIYVNAEEVFYREAPLEETHEIYVDVTDYILRGENKIKVGVGTWVWWQPTAYAVFDLDLIVEYPEGSEPPSGGAEEREEFNWWEVVGKFFEALPLLLFLFLIFYILSYLPRPRG